jgi:glycosyltransferase involved in cell wall biosynthesis
MPRRHWLSWHRAGPPGIVAYLASAVIIGAVPTTKEPTLKILHLYKDYFPVLGGIENHLRVLCEGLAARGHEVTALVTSRTRHTHEQRQGELRVYRAGRLLHAASTPISPAMLRAARTADADLVHLHYPYPPGDLAYFARRDRAPLVVTYHSDIVRQKTLDRLYAPLRERTLAAAARILPTNAPYIQSSPVLRRFAAKCQVVPLSVDLERFASPDRALAAELRARFAPGGEPLALFVGRLRYYKGLHLLIAAMAAAPGNLLIVGTGGEEQALRRQVAGAGLGARVHFAGDVSDVALPAYYAAADMFVLPSQLRAEAFGIVLLEALAAGLPLVTTELGTGTSWVNQHGRTGFVVPPGDPQALARALRALAASDELRRSLGAAGRLRAEAEFGHQRMVSHVEAIYRELLPDA